VIKIKELWDINVSRVTLSNYYRNAGVTYRKRGYNYHMTD